MRHQSENISTYLSGSGEKKLQIGCGSNELKGWLNTDLNTTDTIVYLDAGRAFPIEDNTFDVIYNEHIFEHLTITQQINMLQESFRVLKEGGVLRTATPDVEFLINLYQKPSTVIHSEYAQWAMSHSHHLIDASRHKVAQEDYPVYIISNFLKAWGHQVVHDKKSFASLAGQVGFKKTTFCEVGMSNHKALQDIEKHGSIIPAEYNKLETMVVEVTK